MGRQEIAAAIAGAREYLTANPSEARYRDGAATAVLEDGLRVRVDGGDGASVVSDMVTGIGGGGTAPSPGWLFRAAYAACVATIITMRAAEIGVDLSGLQVAVDSESDDRGILGIDDAVSAGPLSMRISVRVASASGDPEVLREIVAWGITHCPIDDAVRRAVPVEWQLEVVPT
jgi:uncharacterized OsmC-like protein